jgi:hypothetical protein
MFVHIRSHNLAYLGGKLYLANGDTCIRDLIDETNGHDENGGTDTRMTTSFSPNLSEGVLDSLELSLLQRLRVVT